MLDLENEGAEVTRMLGGRTVLVVRRDRETEVVIEFDDGTRLFVDSKNPLELSITGNFLE
jgi:hypothetical protein